ncbi:MAG: hypothetical protein JRI45_01960 [Deltaproteobacteria bacterium]|nr:hypothetical protein [Deltaproteobacteria bacterium]MBW2068083.1 hypothetical protein [Deltaproteobacteria bacterium]
MKRCCFLVFLVFIAGCVSYRTPPSLVAGKSTTPPELVDSFVPPAVWSGTRLPIFVEASDPDGDLAGFRVEVTQAGGNMFENYFVPLKRDGHLMVKGCISLDIPNLIDPEYLTISIQAVDNSGHRSMVKVHRVTVGFGRISANKIPEKWTEARKNCIGHIFFEFERQHDGEDDFKIYR